MLKLYKILSVLWLAVLIYGGGLSAQEENFVQRDSLSKVFSDLNDKYGKNINTEPYMALEYAAQARQVAEKYLDSLDIALSYRNLGRAYFTVRIYYLSMEMQFKAFEIYSKYDMEEEVALCFVDIAKIYFVQDVSDLSEEYCMKAIKIAEANDRLDIKADALAVLGRIYVICDEETSIGNMKKAKHIYDSLKLDNQASGLNVNIARAYLYFEEPDSAIVLLDYNLKYYNDNPDLEKDIAHTYWVYGEVKEFLKDYSSAEEYYIDAVDAFTKLKLTHLALLTKLRLAKMQLTVGKSEDALANGEKILADAQAEELQHGTEEILIKHRACEIIYKANIKLGNQSKALQYCERYALTGDSVYILKRKEQFSEFQVSIENQRQQKELEMMQITAEKSRLLLEKKSYTRNILLLTIIIILIIVLVFIFRYRYSEKKRHNEQLSIANNKMESEIRERKMAEMELKNSEEKYRLLFRKTPIGIIQFSDKFIITTVNDRFLEIFGLSNKNVIGQNISNIFPTKVFEDFHTSENSDNQSVIRQELDIKTPERDAIVAITLKSYYYNTGTGVERGGIMIVQDITESKLAERRAEKHDNLSNILEILPDSFYRLDADGNYIFARVPGLSKAKQDAYLGKNFRDVLSQDLLLPFLVAFNTVRKTGEPQYVDYMLDENDPDTSKEARFTLCDDSTVLVYVRNNTSQKRIENKLKNDRKNAQETSIAKSQFISGMSSKIKEPLDHIVQKCEALVAGMRTDEDSSDLRSVLNSASYVNETLADLLELTEMELGIKNRFTKLVNPVTVGKDVFEIFRHKAEEKHLDYQLNSDGYIPPKMEVDEVRLRQILFNLLLNAITFTEKGSVKVTISTSPSVLKDKINLIFMIADTGVGIKQDKADVMFNSINATSSSNIRGMALSKKMADSMKATITVRSTEGVGSLFTLTIPNLTVQSDTQPSGEAEQVLHGKLSAAKKRNNDAMREYISVLKYAVIPEYKILKNQISFEELTEFVNRFREQSVNYHIDKGIEIADDLLLNIKNYDISSITINTRKLENYVLGLSQELER
ncbi:MAG: PAS domain S-box protein [Bacteroidales bacterium]|nr:PAS domain S-box protein [Bacteroidales bacterium]